MVAVLSLGREGRVFGIASDVTNEESMIRLANFAIEKLGSCSLWVNNAGMSQSVKANLVDTPLETIQQVINTNLIGSMIGVKVAYSIMKDRNGGHIFLMDGAGSSGMTTPTFACYGASKAPFPQLLKTLQTELKGTGVNIHCLSPGMVLTDLLLSPELKNGSAKSLSTIRVFNILAERADTVADFLVRKMREMRDNESGTYHKMLTGGKVVWRFMTAWRFKDRHLDVNGNLIKRD